MSDGFRVGLTHDFLNAAGEIVFGDIGLGLLDEHPRITREFLAPCDGELPVTVGEDYDAVLVLAPRVTSETLARASRLSIVARFGVGYDNVDVEACTNSDVLLTITPGGVRRPVAVSALAMLLGLTHRLLDKDRLTRSGGWGDKLNYMGIGLTGRTLGLVGFGNIGREIAKVAAPLDMRMVAFDPFVLAEDAAAQNVELLELDALLQQSDFVCLCCALTADTRHLLSAARIQLMKAGGVSDQCFARTCRGSDGVDGGLAATANRWCCPGRVRGRTYRPRRPAAAIGQCDSVATRNLLDGRTVSWQW